MNEAYLNVHRCIIDHLIRELRLMEVEYSVQSVQDQVTPSRHNDATSLPAPTRAMSISELRWNIFQMVDAGSYARNMTLLALALTCKSFTEPALDLLWRELHGLSPL